MNKKVIRLTESDLHRIVRRTVNEIIDNVPGYYVCVDTDYSNGCRVECFIGDEHDAKALSMSSEGYAEGPFMSEMEAIEAMKKIQGQYNY